MIPLRCEVVATCVEEAVAQMRATTRTHGAMGPLVSEPVTRVVDLRLSRMLDLVARNRSCDALRRRARGARVSRKESGLKL